MNRDYFYFISGLPNLNFEDNKLSLSLEKFREEAVNQLSEADYQLIEALHIPSEMDNLLRVLYKSKKAANPEGLHSDEYWEDYLAYLRQAMENKSTQLPDQYSAVPKFVAEITTKVLQQEEMQAIGQTELELLARFYTWTAESPNEFIRQWFAFDAHLRNILAAISGRKFGLPYAQYLVGDDELIDKLAKSHAADFGLGKEDELFEALIRIYEQNNILFREKNYDILRWKWIDNQNFFHYFDVNKVLGYYSKLRILSRWLKADANFGKEVFHDTLGAMVNSFTFPEEFNIKSVRK